MIDGEDHYAKEDFAGKKAPAEAPPTAPAATDAIRASIEACTGATNAQEAASEQQLQEHLARGRERHSKIETCSVHVHNAPVPLTITDDAAAGGDGRCNLRGRRVHSRGDAEG